MDNPMQRYLDAVSGVTDVTRARAEQIVKQLVRSGEAAGDQVGDLVEDLLDRQRKNREALTELVKNESVRAVRGMGLATTEEVERLQKQVADLKRELGRIEHEASSSGGGDAAPAEPASKKATKKTAKKATKKATRKSTKKATKKTAKKATKKTARKATKKSTGSGS